MFYVYLVYFAFTFPLSIKGSDKVQIDQGGGASTGSQAGKWMRMMNLVK